MYLNNLSRRQLSPVSRAGWLRPPLGSTSLSPFYTCRASSGQLILMSRSIRASSSALRLVRFRGRILHVLPLALLKYPHSLVTRHSARRGAARSAYLLCAVCCSTAELTSHRGPRDTSTTTLLVLRNRISK